jgi:hypothetical protein
VAEEIIATVVVEVATVAVVASLTKEVATTDHKSTSVRETPTARWYARFVGKATMKL